MTPTHKAVWTRRIDGVVHAFDVDFYVHKGRKYDAEGHEVIIPVTAKISKL